MSLDDPDGEASGLSAGVLGAVAAIGFIAALATSGDTWLMGADRAPAVIGYDGATPRARWAS